MVLLLVMGVAVVLSLNPNPAPGLMRSKSKARMLECERLTMEAAARERPGQIAPAGPRGEMIERSLMVCTERLMRRGLRAPADEAALRRLEAQTLELAVAARALHPELEASTWLVEAYYPSAPVSSKISFATKNALMGQGLSVSDRTPVLSYTDLRVITTMPPAEAYPAACRRYFDNGSLGASDTLMAVVQRDPRETRLHGGLCVHGRWAWLQ